MVYFELMAIGVYKNVSLVDRYIEFVDIEGQRFFLFH